MLKDKAYGWFLNVIECSRLWVYMLVESIFKAKAPQELRTVSQDRGTSKLGHMFIG